MRDIFKGLLRIILYLLHFVHKVRLLILGLIIVAVISLIIYDHYFKSKEKALLRRELSQGIWISSKLHYDTVKIDNNRYFLKARGRLLKFDTTGCANSLKPQSVLLCKDSILTMGSVEIYLGQYAPTLITNQVEIENDSLGDATNNIPDLVFKIRVFKMNGIRETYNLKGDTLISDKGEKYVRTCLIKRNVSLLMEGRIRINGWWNQKI